ncbi:MAG: hypothetical protein ACLTQI_04805 [Slackia sp.]
MCQTYPPWNNALLPIPFLISAMSAALRIASLISGEWAIPSVTASWAVTTLPPPETAAVLHAKSSRKSQSPLINFVSTGFSWRIHPALPIVMAAVPLTVAVPLL